MHPSTHMFCVFIYGPPASGKLTVAKEVQRLTGLPLYHNHLAVDAALSLFPFGSDGFVKLREGMWLSAFRESAAAKQPFIFTFAPEASVRRSMIDEFVSAIENVGGETLFFALTCAEAEIEQRIETTERSKFHKLNSVEMYRQLLASGAFSFPPMPPPVLSIATDKLTPTEVATMIHNKIRPSITVAQPSLNSNLIAAHQTHQD
jgi:hypothetical protein